tara:strand:+ start:17317 stop:17496 length:180 start_codon:yes stop_codon:yes gene_type:complete
MGMQKAIVALLVAAIGLANTLWVIDFNIDANIVNTVVGLIITVGAGVGVWAVPNSTPSA